MEAAITSAGTQWAPLNAAARKATNCSLMSGRAKVSAQQLLLTQVLRVSGSAHQVQALIQNTPETGCKDFQCVVINCLYSLVCRAKCKKHCCRFQKQMCCM